MGVGLGGMGRFMWSICGQVQVGWGGEGWMTVIGVGGVRWVWDGWGGNRRCRCRRGVKGVGSNGVVGRVWYSRVVVEIRL